MANISKDMGQLPVDFIAEIQLLLGREASRELESALNDDPPVSVRLNRSKGFVRRLAAGETAEGVPWCPSGYYLKVRPAFTSDPLFHAGAYYVQEASSMFLEQVLRKYVARPAVVLDLCAAPGGKSTHIRSLLPQGSLLVCNEIIRSRSQVLAENLIKWGHPGVVVTNNQPSDFREFDSLFDLIFADVPCSGEGMFRKDPGAIQEWSLNNVEICSVRQRDIIGDVWDALKPGGLLVYSTCTYNKEENEENIRWVIDELGAQPLAVEIQPGWGITGQLNGGTFPVSRFFPHKTRGEGFFTAVLRKNGDAQTSRPPFRTKPEKKQPAAPAIPAQCRSWLKNPEQFCFGWNGQSVLAIPAYAEPFCKLFRQKLRVVHAGISLAELKGKDLIPDHSLAMSTELYPSAFPVAEIAYGQALAYLRKEAIVLENDIPKGYVLLTYKHTPLGFVKNLGNRANNLYPQEWRIRSGYLSGTDPGVADKA